MCPLPPAGGGGSLLALRQLLMTWGQGGRAWAGCPFQPPALAPAQNAGPASPSGLGQLRPPQRPTPCPECERGRYKEPLGPETEAVTSPTQPRWFHARADTAAWPRPTQLSYRGQPRRQCQGSAKAPGLRSATGGHSVTIQVTHHSSLFPQAPSPALQPSVAPYFQPTPIPL